MYKKQEITIYKKLFFCIRFNFLKLKNMIKLIKSIDQKKEFVNEAGIKKASKVFAA
jgi:hypothetical protein